MANGSKVAPPEGKSGSRITFAAGHPALRALFVVVALIAGFAYIISAWQVFGFAENVWRLPFLLCFGAAVVSDLLSLAGLFATYLLRDAKTHVRAYAWTVFLFMTGLSIAAAESFASWRRLSPSAQKTAGHFDAQVASGAIVVALALAVHLLIVVRRHAGEAPAEPTADEPPARREVRRVEAEVVKETKPVERPKSQVTAPKPARRLSIAGRKGRPVDEAKQAHRDAVAREAKAGTPTIQLAAREGVSTKSIQNWVKDYEARQAATPATTPLDLHELPAATPDKTPATAVNGNAPTLNGGPR